VVAKLDRFGRSLIDGVACIDRIHAAGGTFVSVADGLDLRTDTGRLVLRIMLSMGEWELDRIRSTWNTARERAINRGMYLAPVAPTGCVSRADRRLRPDARSAPVIAELFQRRANGATIAELARLLEERRVRSPYGGLAWAPSSVEGILKNRAYLGESRSGAFLNGAAHPALVDAATCAGRSTWAGHRSPLR
jgi:site-specific DNA recombinase